MSILTGDELYARCSDIFEAETCVASSFRGISYELRLATDECLVHNQYYQRGRSAVGDKGFIEIPPGQLAFLSSIERFRLARDIVGRFGLKFRFVRQGLVPLFTTFIEPGSEGPLFCPVLNASSDVIKIRAEEEIFTVMFHVLPAPVDQKYITPKYDRLPADVINEHLRIRMVSTVELEKQISDFKLDAANKFAEISKTIESVVNAQDRVITFLAPVMAATTLGALLQTMFGLFALTQNITRDVNSYPLSIAWALVPSTLYCCSAGFITLIAMIIVSRRRRS